MAEEGGDFHILRVTRDLIKKLEVRPIPGDSPEERAHLLGLLRELEAHELRTWGGEIEDPEEDSTK